jgi:hypothetical protein
MLLIEFGAGDVLQKLLWKYFLGLYSPELYFFPSEKVLFIQLLLHDVYALSGTLFSMAHI